MDVKLNETLVKKISECIPQNIKPIDYLMDILDISRESAYRRMRSEIAFTFEEVAKLSVNLNFPVDNIIGINNSKERVCFDIRENTSIDAKRSFLAMIEDYYDLVEGMSNSNQVEFMTSVNRIPLFLLINYEMLFKLFYYKWVHHSYKVPVNYTFSEITISSDIMQVREKFMTQSQSIFDRGTFICNRNIFIAIVREIQYYHDRNLISDEEVLLIKKELLELIFNMELIMQKGTNEFGHTYNFYLSLLDVEMNTAYISYDDTIASQYWIYSVSSIIIKNHEICTMHKKWLESLKKSAVLMTQSNEMLQSEFINRQRMYVESVTDKLSYYYHS
jgi:hypothetical protein